MSAVARDGVPARAVALALYPGWVCLPAVAALVALNGPPPLAWQVGPLFASVLLLGLPHGAVDHLVVPRALGGRLTPRLAAAVGGVYAVVGGTYLAGWFLAPAAAFVGFVALTWFHWGQGDVHPVRMLVGGDHLDARPVAVGTLLVRGGMPMLVPLLAFPDQYRRVAGWLVGLFEPDGTAALAALFAPDVRAALAVGFGALVAVTLAAGLAVADDRRAWAVDAGETLLLLGHFATVPPVLAIGVYFCVWHSLRHVVRYLLLNGRARAAFAAGSVGRPLVRFGREAAPLTGLTLVLGAGLYALVPGASTEPRALLGLYLVFIAVLTLPHVLFVSYLDVRDGLWAGGAGGADGTGGAGGTSEAG
jgi:Brp/Blh family beta-carotene 15,15'-monooxygenase